MKNSDSELFIKALQEAMEEKRSEELALCSDEEIIPSARHLRKVSRILGIDVRRESDRKRYPARRVIAWALAAVLMVASALTAYAYSGTSFGFVERVYGSYTQVTFAFSFDIVRTVDIEERYELGYTPLRYELSRVYAHEQRTECTYRTSTGKEIEFQQHPLNGKGEWAFHNELGRLEIRQYGEIYVYCYDCPDSRTFLWRDQKYAMVLCVDPDVADEEILKIINGVRIKP